MDTIQISTQWYAIRWEDDNTKTKFQIVDGPFAEEHWARSMARLNERGGKGGGEETWSHTR